MLAAMRALGFCVSVAHAEYMARKFIEAGIPARAISGETPAAERAATLDDLRARRINAVFAVDVLNEGLDVPDVDTVLLLRPTESATIFLQQLGRGLRRTPTKAVLTVLDFIGYHRKEFSFAQRFRALTGDTRRGLERQVEEGFPFLPSGCQIVLDKQAQTSCSRTSGRRSRTAGSRSWRSFALIRTSRSRCRHSSTTQESSLATSCGAGATPGHSSAATQACATAEGSDLEDKLLKRVRAFAHVDDPERASRI